jgi:hypothetical protein
MVHPILVGHASTELATAVGPSRELRVIAGVPVEPLRPVGNPTAQTDRSGVGSALRNDFAVDRVSRQPVLGEIGAALPTTSRSGLRSEPLRPSVPSATANETERRVNSLRPEAPLQQRSSYPVQTQNEHPAPRPPASVYAPRSAPPPSSPRSAPSAPAPAAPKR